MGNLKTYMACPSCQARSSRNLPQRIPRHNRFMFGLCPGSGQAATVLR